MHRILVADDNPTVRGTIAAALEAAGHDVVQAADGGEAAARLDAGGFDLLVTDLEMPIMDGLDLLQRVRASPRPIPVIMVSGTWTREEKHRAKTLAAAALFEKAGLDLTHLVREVGRLLGA